MAGSITPTIAADALRQEWDGDFRLKANEELVIASDFDRPEGVTKNEITKQLNVRILPKVSASTTNVGATGSGISLDYDDTAPTAKTATPTHAYAAVQIPDTTAVRMVEGELSSFKAGYRKQILSALDEYVDEQAGVLAASLSVQKGAPSNFDASLLTDAHGTLLTQAAEHVKIYGGKTKLFLKYHPSQAKYINTIPQVAEARMRGNVNEASPTQTGVVMEAWGMSLAETGNVYQSAGVTYNMVFAKSCFMLAYNLKPRMKDPQVFEAVVRMIGQVEFAVFEIFDEDGVGVRTPA